MKATIDHIGIAVSSLEDALAFYRDALGLDVEAPEEVPSQRVRAHFIPAGESAIELLEATADDSPIAKYVAKRGPGPAPHHAASRRHRGGARAAQSARRPAHRRNAAPGGARLARRVHPSVERARGARRAEAGRPSDRAMTLEISSSSRSSTGSSASTAARCSASCRSRSGSGARPPDEKNRILLGLRPLLVRGAADDDHRRGDRRQDGREELRDLRHRSRRDLDARWRRPG